MNYQPACKPGSVWRSPSATAIRLGRPLLDASSNQPGRRVWKRTWVPLFRTHPAAPIWSCSRWGLPCRRRCRRRGALLPHPFTLTPASRGGLLSVALSLGSPPAAVSRHRVSMEPGLSSTELALMGHNRPQSRQRPSGQLATAIRALAWAASRPAAAPRVDKRWSFVFDCA